MRRIHDPASWTRHSSNIVGLIALVGLGASVFVGQVGALSIFRSGLDEAPLYWWGLASGFSVMSMLFTLGWSLVLRWLIPRSGNPQRIAKWSLVVVPMIVIISFLHDARSGVALYPGGLTYQQPGFFSPRYSVPYASLEAVETGCVFYRRRGNVHPEVIYDARAPNGDWISLSALRLSDLSDWRGWVAVISDVDHAVSNAGGDRRGSRHAMDGRLLYESGCIEAFASKFDEAGRRQWYRIIRLDGGSVPRR